jgi:hypothetical protein
LPVKKINLKLILSKLLIDGAENELREFQIINDSYLKAISKNAPSLQHSTNDHQQHTEPHVYIQQQSPLSLCLRFHTCFMIIELLTEKNFQLFFPRPVVGFMTWRSHKTVVYK